jgi:hypothetical protein
MLLHNRALARQHALRAPQATTLALVLLPVLHALLALLVLLMLLRARSATLAPTR